MLFSLALLGIFYISSATGKCPTAWSEYGKSCYRVYRDERTWTEATVKCFGLGGHLAVISSADENLFLSNKLDQYYDDAPDDMTVWIGGSDDENEGFWEWQGNDTPITGYTNWDASQPNSAGGTADEDCMGISKKNYRWEDRPCSEDHPFICELS